MVLIPSLSAYKTISPSSACDMVLLFKYDGMICPSVINDMFLGSLFLFYYCSLTLKNSNATRGQIIRLQSKKLLSLLASASNRLSQLCRELWQAEIKGWLKVKELNFALGDPGLFLCFHWSSWAALGKLLQPLLAQVATSQPCVSPHSVVSYHEACGLICRSAKHSQL